MKRIIDKIKRKITLKSKIIDNKTLYCPVYDKECTTNFVDFANYSTLFETKPEAYRFFIKNMRAKHTVYLYKKYSPTNSGKNYRVTESLFDLFFYFEINEYLSPCPGKDIFRESIEIASKSNTSLFNRMKEDTINKWNLKF